MSSRIYILLRFLAYWIIPPAWQALVREYYHNRTNSDLDPRRYWRGAPVASPPSNVPLFNEQELSSLSITIANETRDVTTLFPGQKITLPMPGNSGGFYRLGVASAPHPSTSTDRGALSIDIDGQYKASVDGVQSHLWSDLRFLASQSPVALTIANTSRTRLHISHPVIERPAHLSEVQNIIVIVLDSIVPELLGAYRPSSAGSLTPNIDRFFAQSLVCKNCFSIAEWTLPSIYSILSSTYPITHGFTDLRNSVPTNWDTHRGFLAEKLASLGFSTMACSTAKVFTPGFGAHSGFARFFYDSFPESGRSTGPIVARAIDHLRANVAGKNFLFLHIIDTHEPWLHPSYSENCLLSPSRTLDPNLEFRSLVQSYGDSKAEPIFNYDARQVLTCRRDARISDVDLALRPLFDYLELSGLEDTSAVILTGDHGYQYLGAGGPLLCDSRVRVPMLVKHRNLPPCSIKSFVNQGLDLGPTIAHLAGGNLDTARGNSFLPNAGEKDRQYVISESVFSTRYKVAVRTHCHTFHYHCQYESSSNTILLGSPISSLLVRAGSGEVIPPHVQEYSLISEQMLAIIVGHVTISSRAFGYSLDGL